MSRAGRLLYDDILAQARSLQALGIDDHRLVVVLGYEQERLLALYTQQEHGDPQGVTKYIEGMPIHVGPASCCSVISVEARP